MVDLNTCPPTPPMGEGSKIKTLMGRTPGILKTKFLTVLGNSNELLNGISNKLTLSISSSDSDYCDDDEEVPQFDETIDYTKIDFESRRMKARRAHEEVISGRYRHLRWAPKSRHRSATGETASATTKPLASSSSSARSSSAGSCIDKVTSRSNSIDSKPSTGVGGGRVRRAVAGARRSDLDIANDMRKINELLNVADNDTPPAIDVVEPPPSPPPASSTSECKQQMATNELLQANSQNASRSGLELSSAATVTAVSGNTMRPPPRSRTSNSSTLTSLHDDPALPSPSVESTDWKNWDGSESQKSVASLVSSISIDCRVDGDDENVKEFMQQFIEILFTNASTIGPELKSEFGQMMRLETGRQWFVRLIYVQKLKSKRVDEITFYSMVQFLAIVLFECCECEDFAPATVIMNLSFAFYHEIEVPGCDPYREYLFTYLRQQPIWHTLRFWNAAFFETLQAERERRSAKTNMTKHREPSRHKETKNKTKSPESVENVQNKSLDDADDVDGADDDGSSSSSSHHVSSIPAEISVKSSPVVADDQKIQENIAFKLLGTFTCNMHSLGIRRELCLEFLKKQSATINLPKEKVKLIKENIIRLYYETDLWGAKET